VCMVTASHQFTQPARLAHSTLELAAAELLPLTRKLKSEPKSKVSRDGEADYKHSLLCSSCSVRPA
jgi:hypothetical protein